MADHPRSSEQQEAAQGCGMFDFLKKKPEDAHSSENAGVIKEDEKPSLHLSDSSSSDDEAGEKEKKKKKEDGGNKHCGTEEKKGIMEKIKEKLPAAKTQEQANKTPDHEDGKDKGFMEKLPAAKSHEEAANKASEHEVGKEKGFMEIMKEKLPGGHSGKPEPEAHHEDGKEKGFMEKMKEKLPGHGKHEDNDEKKKET